MPTSIGNHASYVGSTPSTSHPGSLTIGSDARRKLVLCVQIESATTAPTAVSFDGTSIIANARGGNPDSNPNDTALRIFWYDYDIPSGTGAGSKPISLTTSGSDDDVTWDAWEVIGAADGGPEDTAVGHAASGANATASVTSTAGAALLAGGLKHTATGTVTITGDVTERRDTGAPNFTSFSADAANVASGTRTVTATPSSSARNSVRLASYAAYSGGSPSTAPRSQFYHHMGMR